MAKNTVYPMLRRNTKNKLFANFTHLCNLALILLFFLTMLGCAPVASTVITTRAGDVDTDKDGISNAQEISLGLNPNNPDTDGDGLTDGSEIAIELNPLNPDTDSDGISDSDDSMPKLNNTKFFQYIGIGSVIILVTCIIFFQIKFGFTKQRKEKLIQDNKYRSENNSLIESGVAKIMELAKNKYGSLTLDEMAEELNMDPITIKQCLNRINVKKEGNYYRFLDIEKLFKK